MGDCDGLPSILPPLVFSLSVTSTTSPRPPPEIVEDNPQETQTSPEQHRDVTLALPEAEAEPQRLRLKVPPFPAERASFRLGRTSPGRGTPGSYSPPDMEYFSPEQDFSHHPASPDAFSSRNDNSPPPGQFSPRDDVSLATGPLLSPDSEDSCAGERVSLAVPLPYDRGLSIPRWAGILLQSVGNAPRDDTHKRRHVLGERRVVGEARVRPAPEGMLLPCPAMAIALGGGMLSCGSMPRTLSLTAGSEAADEVVGPTGEGAMDERGGFGALGIMPQAEKLFFPCHAMALACGGAVVSCGGIPRTLSQTSATESIAPPASESEVSDDTSDGLMSMSDASGLMYFESRCPLPTISE